MTTRSKLRKKRRRQAGCNARALQDDRLARFLDYARRTAASNGCQPYERNTGRLPWALYSVLRQSMLYVQFRSARRNGFYVQIWRDENTRIGRVVFTDLCGFSRTFPLLPCLTGSGAEKLAEFLNLVDSGTAVERVMEFAAA